MSDPHQENGSTDSGSSKAVLGLYGLVPIALIQDPNVKPNMLKVYIALASFQGANDKCWPSVAAIAKRAGVKPYAVPLATDALVEAGWLIKQRRADKNKTNLYQVLVPVITTRIQENPEKVIRETPENPLYNKNNKENNTSREQQKKPQLPAVQNTCKELGKAVLKQMTDVFPITRDEYPLQAKKARQIADRVAEMAPEAPEQAAAIIIKAYRDMVETGDGFWRSQPFTASNLCSQGIWSRVVDHVRKLHETYAGHDKIENAEEWKSFLEDVW